MIYSIFNTFLILSEKDYSNHKKSIIKINSYKMRVVLNSICINDHLLTYYTEYMNINRNPHTPTHTYLCVYVKGQQETMVYLVLLHMFSKRHSVNA